MEQKLWNLWELAWEWREKRKKKDSSTVSKNNPEKQMSSGKCFVHRVNLSDTDEHGLFVDPDEKQSETFVSLGCGGRG